MYVSTYACMYAYPFMYVRMYVCDILQLAVLQNPPNQFTISPFIAPVRSGPLTVSQSPIHVGSPPPIWLGHFTNSPFHHIINGPFPPTWLGFLTISPFICPIWSGHLTISLFISKMWSSHFTISPFSSPPYGRAPQFHKLSLEMVYKFGPGPN